MEFPRSAGARVSACSAFTVRCSMLSAGLWPRRRGFLDRADQAGVLAEVTQIGQHDMLRPVQSVSASSSPGVGASTGDVVLAAGLDRGGPKAH